MPDEKYVDSSYKHQLAVTKGEDIKTIIGYIKLVGNDRLNDNEIKQVKELVIG